jgi:hypothetical protein
MEHTIRELLGELSEEINVISYLYEECDCLDTIKDMIEGECQEYFDIKEIKLTDALLYHTNRHTFSEIGHLINRGLVNFKTYTLKEECSVFDLPEDFNNCLLRGNYGERECHLSTFKNIFKHELDMYRQDKIDKEKTRIEIEEKDKIILNLNLVNSELKRIISDNGL